MASFNSFGASGFGQPGPFGSDHTPTHADLHPGTLHYSVDPQNYTPADQHVAALLPGQIADLAAHAVAKHNQGIPLTDAEGHALAAYQDMLTHQAAQDGGQDAEVAIGAAVQPSAWDHALGLVTPRNIAIGIGIAVVVSSLRK